MKIITSNNNIDLYEKMNDILLANKIMDRLQFIGKEQKMIKTAKRKKTTKVSDLKGLFKDINVNVNIDLGDIVNDLEGDDREESPDYFEETINIASKKIKDPHYQFTISFQKIKKENKKMFMVCAYARNDYLGGYLLKRNFFFLPRNREKAEDLYDEIVEDVKGIRTDYYEDKISIDHMSKTVNELFTNYKGDIDSEEDTLGTTVNRSEIKRN